MVLSCTNEPKGGDSSMNDDISIALRNLNPEDDKSIDTLAAKVRDRSWKDARRLVELLHGNDSAMAMNASAVLMEVGSLIQIPLIDGLDSRKPEDMVWELQRTIDIQLETQKRLSDLLEELLADKRLLRPPALSEKAEERPIPMRVCDEAYLMLRRLLADEDDDTRLDNIDEFRRMTDEERDSEVERWVKSGVWTPLGTADYGRDRQ
jgi:hypothetical protein